MTAVVPEVPVLEVDPARDEDVAVLRARLVEICLLDEEILEDEADEDLLLSPGPIDVRVDVETAELVLDRTMLMDNTFLDELRREEDDGTRLDSPGGINPDLDDVANEEDVEDADKVVLVPGARFVFAGGMKSPDCVALEVVSEVSEDGGARAVPGCGGRASACAELVEDTTLSEVLEMSSIETEGVGFADVSRVTSGVLDDSSPEGVGFAEDSSVTCGRFDDSSAEVELVGSSAASPTVDEDPIGFGWNEIEMSLNVVLKDVVDVVGVELDETEVLWTKSSNVDDVELNEMDMPLEA